MRARNPALAISAGFAVLILAGTLLLWLPFSSREGSTSVVDALFTATSAVCVTGLTVQQTATHWTAAGQAIIFILLQLGGFGFMTSSILILRLLNRRISLSERILLRESLGEASMADIVAFLRRVAAVTVAVELVGAGLLTLHFAQGMSLPRAGWWGLFHSASAFMNASFDLMEGTPALDAYSSDVWTLLILGVLIVLGGIGFTTMEDVVRRRSWRRLRVDTKLVLVTSAVLLSVGAIAMLALEHNNPVLEQPFSAPVRVVRALFFSMASRTSGFAFIDVSAMHDQTLFLTDVLMFIGGSAGSTAGGIKVQTFSVLLFAILASARGRDQVVAFGREIPQSAVYRALSVALLSVGLVVGVAIVLASIERAPFSRLMFEAVSAFGTVGFSANVTPTLSTVGRLLIVLTMFAGRLGPLTLVAALIVRTNPPSFRYAPELVKVG